jgi:thiol-disulfide isomerase/thioredoxin/outer membrane lipoprotein-sorting protein
MSIKIDLRSVTVKCCLMFTMLLSYGCNSNLKNAATDTSDKQDPIGDAEADETQSLAAEAILDRTIKAYQTAKSYRDNAVLRVVRMQNGVEDKLMADIAVAFERPNRVRCKLDRSLLLSDGEKVYGTTPDWSGQVIVAIAPDEIHVPAFYNDEKLQHLFQQVMVYPIQLDLLTADEPLKEVRQDDQTPVLLEQRPWREVQCDRIGFNMQQGEFVLWIDRKSHLVRRVDYPADANYVVTMELNDAALNEDTPEDEFTWQPSDDQVLVQSLVPPPDAQFQPNSMLGQQVEPFSLLGSDGKKIDLESLKGKITAIDVWATWCAPCKTAMPKFDQVAKKYADADDVQFLAVSVDDQSVDDATIAKELAEIGSKVSSARLDIESPNPNLLDRFGVGLIPLYVILGKDGRLQMLHLGGDITTDMLSGYIDRLRNGEDTYQQSADEANKRWQKMLREFEQQVQAVRADDGLTKTIELPETQLSKASDPEKFELTELWQSSEFAAPGNLLVVESDDGPRILVIDGARRVVELDLQGDVVATHDMLISEKEVVTFLRTAKTKDDAPIYLVGAADQPHLLLFDADWKQLLRYPEDDTAQIATAALADLDGDKTLEMCIGYRGEVGVHGVALDGRRIWRNRSVGQVFGLSVTMPNADGQRRVVCSHGLGTLVPIDHKGREGPPVQLPNRSIMNASVADLDGDGEDDLCTLALGLSNKWSAMGVTADGTILWHHPLPGGFYETPIEPIATAMIDETTSEYWVIAAPDSSIHIISEDGKTTDHFSTGQKLFGLATTSRDGEAVIVAASEKGVTAWSIQNIPSP